MSPEKALNILERLRMATITSNVDGDRVFEPLGIAITALEKQVNDKWVSVDERLPEEYSTYLVAWRPSGENADDIREITASELPHYYEILDFDPDDENGWLDTIDQCEEYVILAWRTLPEPYQADKGGKP